MPLDVGDETLCGDVGRLSLLSNDPDGLNSGTDIRLAWLGVLLCPFPDVSFLDGLDGSTALSGQGDIARRATASLSMFWGGLILLTAEVSIVIVGLWKIVSEARPDIQPVVDVE